MSHSKVRTFPDLSQTSPAHMDALASRDEHLYLSYRNVKDEFKSLPNDIIKSKLKETALPYAICMENWISDFNFSSLVRNGNGFNANKIFYLGDKRWDKRGAQGCYLYSDVEFIKTIDDFIALKKQYAFVAIDNIEGSVPLNSFKWPQNPLMIFGSEGTGLTKEIISHCNNIVHIPMYGSIRSFNAAVASGIVVYDFIVKNILNI